MAIAYLVMLARVTHPNEAQPDIISYNFGVNCFVLLLAFTAPILGVVSGGVILKRLCCSELKRLISFCKQESPRERCFNRVLRRLMKISFYGVALLAIIRATVKIFPEYIRRHELLQALVAVKVFPEDFEQIELLPMLFHSVPVF